MNVYMKNEQGQHTGYFYLSYYDKTVMNPETFVFDCDLGRDDGIFSVWSHDYMPSISSFDEDTSEEQLLDCIKKLNEDDDVDGFIKKDVVITNTGNVDAYIRANIVANWMGTTDTGTEGIALGYTTPSREAFVESWELNYGTNPKSDNYGGKFDTLPGAGWVYAKDGYFYYTAVVKPGDPTGTPLFKQYTNTDDNVPAIYYLSSTGVAPFSNVRLVMDLTVQAIEAKAGVAWDDAWGDEKVLGAKPVPAN